LNDTALYFDNGSFDLLGCTFDNAPRGIKALNSSGFSKIQGCEFNGTIRPVSIESDVSAALQVGGSNFNGNGITVNTPAIYHNFTSLTMGCSMIEDYNTGVLTKNTSLDISEGYNRLFPSSIGIDLDDATGFVLHSGENVFAGMINWDINGTIESGAQLVLSGNKIDASKNSLQTGTSGFKTNILYGSSLIELEAPSIYATEYCPEPLDVNNIYGNLIGNIPTEINVDYEGNQSFSSALVLATNGVFGNEEYEGNLYPALEDVMYIFDQVSNSINPSSPSGDKKVFRTGFSMMFDLLRMNYHYGNIEVVGADPGAPFNTYVTSMNNYINVLKSIVVQDAHYDENIAVWEITRAHLYRLGQYHQQGLDALSSIGGNISAKTDDRINYWNCVMGWEKEMLLGNISPETYDQEFITCGMMYSPFISYGEHEEEDMLPATKPEGKLSIYPNPTSDHIYVRMEDIAHPEDEIELTITGMDGRVLFTRKEQASYMIGINVEQFKQGAYILTVATPYKKHNGQFLIVR
jgi:hypothetical protein